MFSLVRKTFKFAILVTLILFVVISYNNLHINPNEPTNIKIEDYFIHTINILVRGIGNLFTQVQHMYNTSTIGNNT